MEYVDLSTKTVNSFIPQGKGPAPISKIHDKITPMKESFISLLRYSEKYTKTDMVYLTKNGFWVVFSQVIVALCMFFVTWLLANNFSKEDFGTYKFAMTIIALLSLFSLSGMNPSLTRAVSADKLNYLKKVFITKVKWGLLGSLVSLTVSAYYLYKSNLNLSLLFLLLSAFIPFFRSSILYLNFLQGLKDFRTKSTYKTLSQIFLTFSLFVSVLLGINIWLIIFVHLFTWCAINLFFFLKTLKSAELKEPNEKQANEVVTYGKRLSLIMLISVVALNIDSVVLWHFLGPEEIALFAIAYAVPKQLTGLLSFVPQLALPKFSEQKTNFLKHKKALLKKIVKLELALLLVCAFYILISAWFFNLFFPEYAEALIYSQVLIFAILKDPFLVIRSYFVSRKDESSILKITSFPAIGKIIICVILIPVIGIWGLVASILVEALLITIMMLALFLRYEEKNI